MQIYINPVKLLTDLPYANSFLSFPNFMPAWPIWVSREHYEKKKHSEGLVKLKKTWIPSCGGAEGGMVCLRGG